MESILQSVKKFIGVGELDESFDVDITMSINSVLSTLFQLGVGPSTGIRVVDGSELWEDITDSEVLLGLLPSYVGLKVRLMFDPPQSGPLMANIETQIKELEWRISVQRDEEKTNTSDTGMTTFE